MIDVSENMSLLDNDLVLIDFWAPWCGPCKMAEPILKELSDVYGEKITFLKCNVDDDPQLAAKYNIRSIPTIVLLSKGDVYDVIVGVAPKHEIEGRIKELV